MASNQPHTKRDVGGDKPKSKDEQSKTPTKDPKDKPVDGRDSGGSKS